MCATPRWLSGGGPGAAGWAAVAATAAPFSSPWHASDRLAVAVRVVQGQEGGGGGGASAVPVPRGRPPHPAGRVPGVQRREQEGARAVALVPRPLCQPAGHAQSDGHTLAGGLGGSRGAAEAARCSKGMVCWQAVSERQMVDGRRDGRRSDTQNVPALIVPASRCRAAQGAPAGAWHPAGFVRRGHAGAAARPGGGPLPACRQAAAGR